MTLEEMGLSGFTQTEKEIKQFNTLLAKEYKKALDSIRADIQKVYNKVIGDNSPAQLAAILKEQPAWLYTESAKFDRLSGLQKKVQTQFIKASIAAGNMTVESSKLAITNNFYKQQFALDFASPVKLSFTVLNPKVVEISVLGTPKVYQGIVKATKERLDKVYGDITKYQAKHGTLVDVILNNRKAQLAKIQSSITQSLIQGKSYTQTAKDVKGIMDSTASQAIRIVRTESGRNMNSGAFASHNVALSQGLDIKRMAIETLDDRTRGQSQFIDGTMTDENDQFTYPRGLKVDIIGNSGVAAYDINERGQSIEIIDDQAPETRTGRNPVTGVNEQMSFKDFNTWAKENGMVQNSTGRWVLKN